jgi:hypothetical protein
MTRALFAFALLVGNAAMACPVCGQQTTDKNQAAYMDMTVFMSLTPLLAMGGVVLWIYWRVKQAEKAEQSPPEPLPSSPAVPATTQVQQQNASA